MYVARGTRTGSRCIHNKDRRATPDPITWQGPVSLGLLLHCTLPAPLWSDTLILRGQHRLEQKSLDSLPTITHNVIDYGTLVCLVTPSVRLQSSAGSFAPMPQSPLTRAILAHCVPCSLARVRFLPRASPRGPHSRMSERRPHRRQCPCEVDNTLSHRVLCRLCCLDAGPLIGPPGTSRPEPEASTTASRRGHKEVSLKRPVAVGQSSRRAK